MTTVPSITRACKIRRRLLLAAAIAMVGCVDRPSLAVADEATAPPSYLTFRQLFENETRINRPASIDTLADDVTIRSASQELGMAGSDGLSQPSLVSYLQEDLAVKAKSEDESDAKPLATEKPVSDRLGGESIFGGDAVRSPSVENGRFELPPFMVASTETREIGNGRTPDGFRGDDPQLLELLPENGLVRDADWDWTVRTWAAPNTFSHPRYFEDRMLERHGHERFPYLQPMVSGARFFATIPMLPYLAAVRNPCDCEYTLGYYRPGSCVPALKQRPPYERKAVIAEAAAVAKTVLILP